MSLLQPQLLPLDIGLGQQPILTSPYPIWLTAAQIGSLTVVSLISVVFALLNILAAWRRWRGGAISLGEDGNSSGKERLPPKNLKEAQDREIWDNVRAMVPERDEPIELELFWRKAILRSAGLLLVSLPSLWLLGGNIGVLLTSHEPWSLKLPIAAYILSTLIQISLAWYSLRNQSDLPGYSKTIHQYLLIAMANFISQFSLVFGPSLVSAHTGRVTWMSALPVYLALAQFIYSGCMPLGPRYRLDKRHLYNRGVRAALDKDTAPAAEYATAQEAEDAGHAPRTETFGVDSVTADASVSLFSWITMGWVPPVISAAARMSQVDVQHLPAVPHDLRSQEIAQQLHDGGHANQNEMASISSTRLFWRLCLAQMGRIVPWFSLRVLAIPLDYLPHVALQMLLSSVEGGLRTDTALAWAGMLIIAKIARSVIGIICYQYDSQYIAPRMRNHAMLLIFRKLLTRNTFTATGDGQEDATADINPLTIITTDVSSLINILDTGKDIITGQLELLLAGFYIWSLLGISGLFGLSTLLIIAIPSYFLSRIQFRVRSKLLAVRDERNTLMQEAIQAISMIKMMAVELFWHRRIMTIRKVEFDTEFNLQCLSLVTGLLQSIGPDLILAVSFAHYTLVRKQTLTASIAFTAINVFAELRPILDQMPTYITELLDELLAARRVAAFLRLPDIEPLEGPARQRTNATYDFSIRGTITWKRPVQAEDQSVSERPEQFKLVDLDVTFPRGKTTLVAGKFGSGKTLLLQGFLGEAHLLQGQVTYAVSTMLPPNLADYKPIDWSWDIVPETVAYAPQTAWLLSASIRENILFGLPMDIERYKQVVFGVGLLPDFAILDDSDLTEIGERGKILSGGQKARVSLARAMYSRAATVILDDVISAVDATTSQHILQHCFASELMKDRTLIIASHAVEALAPLADQAIFLDDSRIAFAGTGPQLLQSEYMRHLATEAEVGETVDEARIDETNQTSGLASHDFEVRVAKQKTPRQLIVEDARSDGSVKAEHWWNLIKANGGVFQWSLTGLAAIIACLGPVVCMKILALWTEDVSHPTEHTRSVQFWLIVYCCASLGSGFVAQIGYFWMWRGSFKALRNTHKEILTVMLGATMPYFSKTRAGSILQRFGRDLDDITSASRLIYSMSTRIITMTLYGGWPFALATFVMLALMYKPSLWYRSASRQMRRLEMVIPGLVNAIYTETIAGSAVVRAFGAHSVMINELLQTLNMRQCANTWRFYTSCWLFAIFRALDVGMLAAVLAVILFNPNISASTAGFLISFVEGLSISLNWAILDLRNMELDGISLERIADFRSIKQENQNALRAAEEDARVADWPSQGAIKATDICARYEADLPDILHDVCFDIEGGTKIGIVGASGGGKSTLAKTLFSFVQVSGGKIEIDGVDISTINLSRLRSSLGIIAQDPILLSGSLRLNLDIESQYSDADLYEALRQVQLIKVAGSKAVTPAVSRAPSIRTAVAEGDDDDAASTSSTAVGTEVAARDATIFNDLDSKIKSGGENAGQKQLVVLARAILKQHKILIMDEATASIDSETDQAISRIVHDGFKGATVLIIAHRLRTIMPCAKILVLDKGRIMQQGSPLELIRQQGKFKELCEAAGKEEYSHLCSIAETESKRNDGYLVDV